MTAGRKQLPPDDQPAPIKTCACGGDHGGRLLEILEADVLVAFVLRDSGCMTYQQRADVPTKTISGTLRDIAGFAAAAGDRKITDGQIIAMNTTDEQ